MKIKSRYGFKLLSFTNTPWYSILSRLFIRDMSRSVLGVPYDRNSELLTDPPIADRGIEIRLPGEILLQQEALLSFFSTSLTLIDSTLFIPGYGEPVFLEGSSHCLIKLCWYGRFSLHTLTSILSGTAPLSYSHWPTCLCVIGRLHAISSFN